MIISWFLPCKDNVFTISNICGLGESTVNHILDSVLYGITVFIRCPREVNMHHLISITGGRYVVFQVRNVWRIVSNNANVQSTILRHVSKFCLCISCNNDNITNFANKRNTTGCCSIRCSRRLYRDSNERLISRLIANIIEGNDGIFKATHYRCCKRVRIRSTRTYRRSTSHSRCFNNSRIKLMNSIHSTPRRHVCGIVSTFNSLLVRRQLRHTKYSFSSFGAKKRLKSTSSDAHLYTSTCRPYLCSSAFLCTPNLKALSTFWIIYFKSFYNL